MTQLSFTRMKGLALRHLYPLRRDFDLLSDMIYWPLIDIVLWGVTSQWLSETSGSTQIVVTILMGLILWNVIWRSQAEVSRNLMDEIWNNNLVNLFSTPLTTLEWILTIAGLSVVKTFITLSVVIPSVLFLYSVNVLNLGWWLPVFYILTSATGWWIGFISAGIVLRWGPKVQNVIWTLPGFLLPFSAIYYPVDRLPAFVQPFSWILPTTYVMESMRALLNGGEVNVQFVITSAVLNLVWLTIAMYFFLKSFRYSKKMGLSRFY